MIIVVTNRARHDVALNTGDARSCFRLRTPAVCAADVEHTSRSARGVGAKTA
jgi:hypothetical protein